MRKLCIYLIVFASVVGLFGCTAEQQEPERTEENETINDTTYVPEEKETQPDAEETSEIGDKLGQQDTYWVASEWYSEDTDEREQLQPDTWALDLMIYVDGTARFRDIHDGISLVDDSLLALSWERTDKGELLFFSKLYSKPVLRGTCENGVLYLNYYGVTLTMNENEMPKDIGEVYTPAELAGTWLMVCGETEGWQWEAMPNELSSLVFHVAAYDGPLEMWADMETLDYYGTMTDADYGQEVLILNKAIYDDCENNSWCVRMGPESPKDENGYPTETEFYATLLDYNTLLLQRYYTIDGCPAVSYQTYWRFPKIVSWRMPEYIELGDSNWACTGYVNSQREDRSPPEEMEDFAITFNADQTCFLFFGEDIIQGAWQVENGGVILLRGAEEEFWFGGAISAHSVETTYEVSDAYEMALYYNGGILRLKMTGYG